MASIQMGGPKAPQRVLFCIPVYGRGLVRYQRGGSFAVQMPNDQVSGCITEHLVEHSPSAKNTEISFKTPAQLTAPIQKQTTEVQLHKHQGIEQRLYVNMPNVI